MRCTVAKVAVYMKLPALPSRCHRPLVARPMDALPQKTTLTGICCRRVHDCPLCACEPKLQLLIGMPVRAARNITVHCPVAPSRVSYNFPPNYRAAAGVHFAARNMNAMPKKSIYSHKQCGRAERPTLADTLPPCVLYPSRRCVTATRTLSGVSL